MSIFFNLAHWASFRKLTDFTLFEVSDERYPGCHHDEVERLTKEKDFLLFLEKLNINGPVHMAVFSHSGRHISSSLITKLHESGIWTVIMSADDQHQFISPVDQDGHPHQLRVATIADLYWSSWPLAVRIINSMGGNGWFAPHGADSDIYRPLPCAKDLEIVFVGGCSGMRGDIVKSVGRFFDVTTFGYGWPNGLLPFDQMIHVFNRAKIVLGVGGIGHRPDIQMLKGRDFEVPMCGVTYLTSSYSLLSKYFVVGKEICCWSSVEDCIEAIADLLDDDEKCSSIGQAARKRSLTEHTWDHRLVSLFKLFQISNMGIKN